MNQTTCGERFAALTWVQGVAREWIKAETYVPTIPNWGLGSDHRPLVAAFEAADK